MLIIKVNCQAKLVQIMGQRFIKHKTNASCQHVHMAWRCCFMQSVDQWIMSSIPYKYNPLVYCCSQKAAENYRVFETIIKYYKSRMRKFSSMKFIKTPLFNLWTYCFIIRYILFAIYFFPLYVVYRSVTKLLNILNMCAFSMKIFVLWIQCIWWDSRVSTRCWYSIHALD